ncbi:hypothetical protein ACSZNO_21455 [Aeromonas veronii]
MAVLLPRDNYGATNGKAAQGESDHAAAGQVIARTLYGRHYGRQGVCQGINSRTGGVSDCREYVR